MEDSSQSTATLLTDNHDILDKVKTEQINLIFRQVHVGIISIMIVGFIVLISYWHSSSWSSVRLWFGYVVVSNIFWLSIVYAYHHHNQLLDRNKWLTFFLLGMMVTTAAWGYLAIALMPSEGLLHQTFIIIILLGISAAANPFFSPVYVTYVIYLIPMLIPLIIWFFLQKGIYFLLGFCAIIYLIVMLGSCYYSNRFILSSLMLRYKNINLDTINQLLEKSVAERTQALEKSLAVTKSTLESTADGILVLNLDSSIEFCNQKFTDMWELLDEHKPNNNSASYLHLVLKHINNPIRFQEIIEELDTHPQQEATGEISFINGNFYEWYSKPHLIKNIISGRVWCFHDITMRKEMEEQLTYQASHDLLTGLPNRSFLYEKISQAIHNANNNHHSVIIMFLDIDYFKLINDNLGHNIGDILLKKVAHRLKSCLKKEDTVARLGGDEFIVLISFFKTGDIHPLAERLLHAVNKPMMLSDQELAITVSIGMSIYPQDGTDATTLLKNADLAMYLAKSKGRNNIQVYNPELSKKTKVDLEKQLTWNKSPKNNSSD